MISLLLNWSRHSQLWGLLAEEQASSRLCSPKEMCVCSPGSLPLPVSQVLNENWQLPQTQRRQPCGTVALANSGPLLSGMFHERDSTSILFRPHYYIVSLQQLNRKPKEHTFMTELTTCLNSDSEHLYWVVSIFTGLCIWRAGIMSSISV